MRKYLLYMSEIRPSLYFSMF